MPTSRDLSAVALEVKEFAKLGLYRRSVPAQATVLSKCPSLRDLPATQMAATDQPTPRFEYLVQAIIDAIDAIGLRGHTIEAAALRSLCGLADSVRRANWAKRQEEAARVFGVGRDHFRRCLQHSLLVAVAEILLASTTVDTVERQGGALGAVPAQDILIDRTVALIRDETPQEALLLELSTATIGPVINALCISGVATRLLVSNPYTSRSAWQQERVWMTLVDRFQNTFKKFPELEVRLYEVPPSLRGRLIGNQLYLGWYTYRDDPRYGPEDPNASVIWGHGNAMIHGSSSSPEGEILSEWFRREFERLWHHRLTRRGAEIARALGLEP